MRRLLRRATRPARLFAESWSRWRDSRAPAELGLDGVRRRLEVLLAALYGREIPIDAAAEPPKQIWIARLTEPRHLRPQPVAANDGTRIYLPAQLDASDGIDAAVARYRLLALEQAERVARGTAQLAESAHDLLERDLFLLREGAAIDRALVSRSPSLTHAIAAARAAALRERPSPRRLTRLERAAEALLQEALADEPAREVDLSEGGSAASSLAWARDVATRLRATAGEYRGLSPVASWGTVLPPEGVSTNPVEVLPPWWHAGSTTLLGFESRGAGGGKDVTDDVGAGGDPSVRGAPEATDDERARPANGAAAGEHDRAEPPTAAGAGTTAARDEPGTGAGSAPAGGAVDGASYPEWDTYAGRYLRAAATVRTTVPNEGDAAWADHERRAHGALVRRVRQRFERLRARRMRLRQQRDGDELDLAACVSALVDRRAGHTVDDRLYVAVRPARRGLAIALLVDVSGSTEAPLGDGRRVIDVEKTALLLASEALDGLGDRYAIIAFSGRGAGSVTLKLVKGFAEPNGEAVRRRMAGLAPSGNTRLGAAVRHATSLLVREPAGHRLLLLLSDGRPNDTERYQGDYAVEDSRQAIVEARDAGVYPFCLTVDRESPEYLTRIFGAAGHTILRRPEHLPLALVQVVRQLLAS